jgi:beta-N-acetylhexosaminidase
MGMTAHLVYTAWDAERPGSLSPVVIGDVIRGRIGFDGFLMSDDLGMNALTGAPGDRATRAVAAGCDVGLHCSGDLAEMEDIAAVIPALSERAQERLESAMATIAEGPADETYEALAEKRDSLLAYA